MSVFPLNIEDKEDSADKLARLEGVPSKFYETSEEINRKREGIEENYNAIKSLKKGYGSRFETKAAAITYANSGNFTEHPEITGTAVSDLDSLSFFVPNDGQYIFDSTELDGYVLDHTFFRLNVGVFKKNSDDVPGQQTISGYLDYLKINEIFSTSNSLNEEYAYTPSKWLAENGTFTNGQFTLVANGASAGIDTGMYFTSGYNGVLLVNLQELTNLDPTGATKGLRFHIGSGQIYRHDINSDEPKIIAIPFTASTSGNLEIKIDGSRVNDNDTVPIGTTLCTTTIPFCGVISWSQEKEDEWSVISTLYNKGDFHKITAEKSLIAESSIDGAKAFVKAVANESKLEDALTSKSKFTNLLESGDFKSLTPISFINGSGVLTSNGVEATMHTSTGAIAAVRFTGDAISVKEGQRLSLILDIEGVNVGTSKFIATIRKFNGDIVSNGVLFDNATAGNRITSAITLDIESGGISPFSAYVFLQPNNYANTETTLFRSILVLNLGTETDVNYNISNVDLQSIYKQNGFFFPSVNVADYANFSRTSNVAEISKLYQLFQGEKIGVLGDSNAWQNKILPRLAELCGFVYNAEEIKVGSLGKPPTGSGGSVVRAIYNSDNVYTHPYGANGVKNQGASIYKRADVIKHYNYKKCLIIGGQNDGSLSGVKLGTINDAPYEGEEVDERITPEEMQPTFYASYKGMLKKLCTENPHTKFIIITTLRNWWYSPSESYRGRYEVVQAIIECAKLYGCQVVNLYEELGINEFNAGISLGETGESEEIWYQKDSTEQTFQAGNPRVHWTDELGVKIAELIASKLM